MAKFNEISKDEHAKISSAGGKASVIARREKAKFKSAWEIVSDLPLRDEVARYLSSHGCTVEDMSRAVAIVERLTDEALQGNTSAATLLYKMSGEEKTVIEQRVQQRITIENWTSFIKDARGE